MKTMPTLVLLALAPQANAQVVDEFIAAERAFAAFTAERGIRAGFLAHLAHDGVVFTPLARNGIEAYSAAPQSETTVLEWAPIFAEASAGGDLGYTTGPWQTRPAPGDSVNGSGYYFSIWRRDDEGRLRVVLDLGTGADAPVRVDRTSAVEVPPRPGFRTTASRSAGALASLEMADEAFARADARSRRKALTDFFARDGIHNDGGSWVRARAVAERAPDAGVRWHRRGSYVATSGDLGYSWGEYLLGHGTQPSGNEVRIWRRLASGEWRIVFMVTSPVPADTGA